MTKTKQDFVFNKQERGAWSDPSTNHIPSEKQFVSMQKIVGKCRREEILLGRGWFARQRSLAWGVLRGLWLATGWVARQPSEEEILWGGLLGSEITIATRHVNQMEMEMVFNGYSLTGFSITIYNNIIIINTKILMYNK